MSGPQPGTINAWQCDKCRGLLVAVHLHEGTTPMFLACRRITSPRGKGGPCGGRGASLGYPPPPIPTEVLDAVAWEWRLPTSTERKTWRREGNHGMLDHVDRGGLVLAALSPEGARLVERTHKHRPKGSPT